MIPDNNFVLLLAYCL